MSDVPIFIKGAELKVNRAVEAGSEPRFKSELLQGVFKGCRQTRRGAVWQLTG